MTTETQPGKLIAIAECTPYSDDEVAAHKRAVIALSETLGSGGNVNDGSILHETARLIATIEAFQGEVKRLNEEVRGYMESEQLENLS